MANKFNAARRLMERTRSALHMQELNKPPPIMLHFPHYPENLSQAYVEGSFVVVGDRAMEIRAEWPDEKTQLVNARIGANTYALFLDEFAEKMANYFDLIVCPSFGNYEKSARSFMQESILESSIIELTEAFEAKLNERRELAFTELENNSTRSIVPKTTQGSLDRQESYRRFRAEKSEAERTDSTTHTANDTAQTGRTDSINLSANDTGDRSQASESAEDEARSEAEKPGVKTYSKAPKQDGDTQS